MIKRVLILAACFAIGGCSTMSDFGTSMRKESLRNDQGHVIGYKDMMRNERRRLTGPRTGRPRRRWDWPRA